MTNVIHGDLLPNVDMGFSSPFTQAQRICAQTYEQGEFEHVLEAKTPQELQGKLDACGDGVFAALMTELAATEDCHGLSQAWQRMSTVLNQVSDVAHAISEAECDFEGVVEAVLTMGEVFDIEQDLDGVRLAVDTMARQLGLDELPEQTAMAACDEVMRRQAQAQAHAEQAAPKG